MHDKHGSGLDRDTRALRNQDNSDDALADEAEGLHAPDVVYLFGRRAAAWMPGPQALRWILAFLVGVVLVGTLVALSGCQALVHGPPSLLGLSVVSADDCRHPLHTTPCSTPKEVR